MECFVRLITQKSITVPYDEQPQCRRDVMDRQAVFMRVLEGVDGLAARFQQPSEREIRRRRV